jgi:stress-induced morphogen
MWNNVSFVFSFFKVFLKEIELISEEFEGKTILQQHKLVQEILKKEIKEMHGLTLKTKSPKKIKKEEL